MMNMCSMPFPACASELNRDVLLEEKLHFISQLKLAILSGERILRIQFCGTQVPNEKRFITLCLMRCCVVFLFEER